MLELTARWRHARALGGRQRFDRVAASVACRWRRGGIRVRTLPLVQRVQDQQRHILDGQRVLAHVVRHQPHRLPPQRQPVPSELRVHRLLNVHAAPRDTRHAHAHSEVEQESR
jgi:hypothetical protein